MKLLVENNTKTQMTLDLYQIMMEEVGNGSNNLVTRETGRVVRERIEKEVMSGEWSVVSIDFSGVGIIDYSCADEVIARLASRLIAGEYGVQYIALTGLNPNQEENIQVAMEKKRLAILKTDTRQQTPDNRRQRLRNQGTVPDLRTEHSGVVESGLPPSIIGFLPPHLKEALDLVNQKRTLTAKELANALNIELNTASTRLINLYKKHLVTRTEKLTPEAGRQFVYGRVECRNDMGRMGGLDTLKALLGEGGSIRVTAKGCKKPDKRGKGP